MESTRPPPSAPRFAFATRVYRHDLRPIVITLAALSALWSLFSSVSFFRAIPEEKSDGLKDLVPISIAVGSLYIAVTVIEIFGTFSAITRKLSLVRIYAYLSAFTTIIVLAGGLVRVVIHFTKKSELIQQCSTTAQEDGVAVYPFGFWGPVRSDDLTKSEADRWCTDSWNHYSWSEIVSMLFTTLLAGFWTMIVYAYYRQLLDPSSVANVTRIVAVPTNYPNHYNPPYGYGYNMPYAGGPPPAGQWQPPPGAPPPGHWQPPSGPPPAWEDGYTQHKDRDVKGDNPFEDFTEIPENERKDRPKP